MIRRMLGSLWAAATLAIAAITMFGADAALAGMGIATDGQLGMQDAASPIARQIHEFHDMVNFIIIVIAVFVLILMVYVMFRFNAKANPTPSRTTHNTLLEVAWTVIPIMILVYIALPSFRLLRAQYDYPPPDVTIKATAYQWYWNHEYLPKEKDAKGFGFDSLMLTPEEIKEKQAEGIPAPRNLAVDNEVVVPVNKNVHVLVTAGDVLHNWTVPGFGSKVDAVPGRINTTWFRAEKTGVFYGQCSELCGKDHAFMPIAVRVVDEGIFSEWSAAMAARDKKKAREILKRVALEQAGKKAKDVAAAQQ
jgi:cytochrome c oxidase subunit 2